MNSILHTAKFVLISACVLFIILPSYAGEQGGYTPPDYTSGAYLFIPSINNFNSLDFAYSHKVYKGVSLRTNLHMIQVSDRSDVDRWENPSYTDQYIYEADTDYFEINMSMLAVWPIRNVDRIEMYCGIGPYLGYSMETSESIMDGANDTHIGNWQEGVSFSLGSEFMVGFRYWVFQRVAVVGEYYGRIFFTNSETNYDRYSEETEYKYQRSREIEASDFYCRLYKVRLGLSYYF